MPLFVEISGGIDVCGKPLITRFETVFSIFICLQTLIRNFVILQKLCECWPTVSTDICSFAAITIYLANLAGYGGCFASKLRTEFPSVKTGHPVFV